jgi:hypothetical protein
MKSDKSQFDRRKRGFERAAGLVQRQIRSAGETRGFAESRLLTDWAEIVGNDNADMCRPIKVSYAKGGFGATLVLLTTGSHAPILQASLPKIKDRVNACYGYAAISHIRITQTAPTGFADGRVEFRGPKPKATSISFDTEVELAARQSTQGIGDADLSAALERLGKNVLSKSKSK